MRDDRLDKLADVIVRYSVGVKQGDLVRLSGDPVGLPLLEAVYEKVIEAGAHAFWRSSPEAFEAIMYEKANDEQLQYVSELSLQEIKTIDCSIGLWADVNTKSLSRVDPAKQGLAGAARKEIGEIFMKRAAAGELRWCGTQYPTNGSAQDAEMSLREYEDFVFKAGHLDKVDPVAVWQEIEKRQQLVADYLNGKKEVRFQSANGTDVVVNVSGMKWINCCGHENFPDGEVFTGPNLKAEDGGINGYVKYSFPAVHLGREVDGVELWFEKGKVVKAKAEKNEEFLLKMLDMDEGARAVGEVAIGTNYQIQEYTKNTLFDEKIGGTFHIAVGAGYPETRNENVSGLHWDMVCDLREGGTITVDGEVISKDGRFINSTWPSPSPPVRQSDCFNPALERTREVHLK
ncbi:Aminopeptidase 2 [Poriferisphaera corsica]|uniref:Aminopeptidase 2 n=1 Tax=Poriferisphaera corsica TaxID=2528020 RepID=A0A517YRH3_9BACT|nr:aminopeptidase [Poriferisphaera corsica]QDU32822.1 Aminopeptidase 2 [Poriferisphaera corsica]